MPDNLDDHLQLPEKENRIIDRWRVQLLDLDDTLIDDRDATHTALQRTLAGHGTRDDADAIATVLEHAVRTWRAHPHRRHPALADVSSWESLWIPADHGGTLPDDVADTLAGHDTRVWASALTELGEDPATAVDAAEAYRRHRRTLLRLRPGVADVLAEQARTHRLWLVTNGAAGHQRAKIESVGLDAYLDRIWISGEVGASKPSREFAAAIQSALDEEHLQVCQLVGDSESTDLRLAEQAGWPAVHLCPGTAPCRANSATVRHAVDVRDAVSGCPCPAPHPVGP